MAFSPSASNWHLPVYSIGFSLSLFYLIYRLSVALRYYFTAKPLDNHYYVHSDIEQSFTFLDRIILSENDAKSSAHHLLKHEEAHRKLGHSLDILLAEFMMCILWFSPFTRLLVREIKQNHEYEADLIAAKGESKAYANYLIEYTRIGAPQLGSAFSTPFSNLKKRILMINQQNQLKMNIQNVVMAGLIIIGSAVFFSCETQTLSADEVDEMPQFGTEKADLMAYFQDNFTYPEVAKDQGLEGKVIVQFTVAANGELEDIKAADGSNPILATAAEEFVRNMPSWEAGSKDGEKVAVRLSLPVMYKLPQE